MTENEFKDINSDNVEKLVRDCWNEVKSKVETGHPLSSEKVLVLLFTIELYIN